MTLARGCGLRGTPTLADNYMQGLPHTPPPECLVFQPLEQVSEASNPLAVVFLVNADQLSGLITLANYDRPTQDNVKVLFGAGCVQSILYSLCQEEARGDTCYLGLTDPSARLHASQNCSPFPPLSSFPRVGRQGGGEFPHYRNLEKDLPPDFTQTIIRISPIERRRCFALHTILQHHISVERLPPGAADSCPGDFHEHKGRPWRLPYYLSLLQRFLIWSHNFGNITLVLYTCFILVEVVLHSMLLRRGSCPAAWVGPFCCWMPCNFL